MKGALTGSSHIGDLYGSGNDVGIGSASVVASGNLSGLVSFGADGPNATAEFQLVSPSSAGHWLDNLNLTSHGSDINSATIANEGGGVQLLTASAADGHEVFTLALNETSGAWTFTLINPIDDPFGHGENSQTIDLSGLVQGVDFDGDAVTLASDFSVKVIDDVPVLVSGTSTSGAVDEGGLTTHGGDLFGSGNDHGAAITPTGSLSGLVSFGADGPETGTVSSGHGFITINEGFQLVSENAAQSWLASLNRGNGITSHGQAVNEVDISISNGVETLTASTGGNNGWEVFTLQLNETTGAWTFTLINPLDESTGGGENTATIDLSGLVQGVDFDGDAVHLSGDFSVTVTDDVPVLTGSKSSGTVNEGGLTSGSTGDLYGAGNEHSSAVVASGSLANLVAFGADGPQSGTFSATFIDHFGHHDPVSATIADGFQLVGATAAGTWLGGLSLTSHNQAINFATVTSATSSSNGSTVSDVETLTAWTNGGPSGPNGGGHEVFTLTLDVTTGAWTFDLINPIDQTSGNGENSALLDLSGLVQAIDFDGDAVTLSGDFKVTVTDDVPILASGASGFLGTVNEGGLPGGNEPSSPTVFTATSGSLDTLVSFGADGKNATPFQFVSNATAVLTALNIDSHGALVDTASVSGTTLTAGCRAATSNPRRRPSRARAVRSKLSSTSVPTGRTRRRSSSSPAPARCSLASASRRTARPSTSRRSAARHWRPIRAARPAAPRCSR